MEKRGVSESSQSSPVNVHRETIRIYIIGAVSHHRNKLEMKQVLCFASSFLKAISLIFKVLLRL